MKTRLSDSHGFTYLISAAAFSPFSDSGSITGRQLATKNSLRCELHVFRCNMLLDVLRRCAHLLDQNVGMVVTAFPNDSLVLVKERSMGGGSFLNVI